MTAHDELLFVAALLIFAAFISWLIARAAIERSREQARRSRILEAQIEKFADAQDFIAFARTEAGLAWLRADSGEARLRRGLLVLPLVGMACCAVGIALLVTAGWLGSTEDTWWGIVLIALGVASLLSFWCIVRIGRDWGLIPPTRRDLPSAGDE